MSEIARKVEEWFFDDEDFESSIKDWTKAHCDVFDDSAEHKLEYTPLHKEYCKLMEDKVEAFLKSNGYTGEQFSAELQKVRSLLESSVSVSCKEASTPLQPVQRCSTLQEILRINRDSTDQGRSGCSLPTAPLHHPHAPRGCDHALDRLKQYNFGGRQRMRAATTTTSSLTFSWPAPSSRHSSPS